jgi:flagellar motor switch protein FliN
MTDIDKPAQERAESPILDARERPSSVATGPLLSPSLEAREGRELRSQLERKPSEPSPAAAMESLLHDVPLEVSVELGRVRLPLGELAMRLSPGAVIPLDKLSGALLDVRVQSRLIARAEAVAIGERCGIRILELVGGGDS